MNRISFLILVTAITTVFSASAEKGEGADPFQLRPADEATLSSLLDEGRSGARFLRQFMDNGTASATIRGERKKFSCDRAKEPDYCDRVTAWICARAGEMRSQVANDVRQGLPGDAVLREFSATVLNGFELSTDEQKALLYERALEKFSAGAQPPAQGIGAEWMALANRLNREVIGLSQLLTPNARASIAAEAFNYRQSHAHRIDLDRPLPPGPIAPNMPLWADRVRVADEALEMMKDSLRAQLGTVFGRLPAFSVAASRDGKVYVSFELNVPNGPRGRIVAEVTASFGGAPAGPSLIPVTIQPDFQMKIKSSEFGPRFACSVAVAGRSVPPELSLSPNLVSVNNDGNYLAYPMFEMEQKVLDSRYIYPPDAHFPFGPKEHLIAVSADGSGDYHPAQLMPLLQNDEAAPGAPAEKPEKQRAERGGARTH